MGELVYGLSMAVHDVADGMSLQILDQNALDDVQIEVKPLVYEKRTASVVLDLRSAKTV